MLEVYTISSNLPSRQAIRWLSDHDISFTEFRVHSDRSPITVAKLKQFLSASEAGVDDLFAFQSGAYRAFITDHDPDEMPLSDLLNLMTSDFRLIHYPLLFDDQRHLLQTGFSQDEIRVFLPRDIRIRELQQLLNRSTYPQVVSSKKAVSR